MYLSVGKRTFFLEAQNSKLKTITLKFKTTPSSILPSDGHRMEGSAGKKMVLRF